MRSLQSFNKALRSKRRKDGPAQGLRSIFDDSMTGYNCIRTDANFRSEVTAELRHRDTPNQQETTPGNSPRVAMLPATRGSAQPAQGGELKCPPRPEEQPSEVLKRQPIPYQNLPSLIELYTQFSG